MTRSVVWINGASVGHVDPMDRGVTLGDGVFDTLVAFHRIPFAGNRHLSRLQSHAAAIGIQFDPEFVRSGWGAVLREASTEHSIIRTTVTRGASGRGLWPASFDEPTIVVTATPWTGDAVAAPVQLVTSAIRRNASSPTSRLKSIGYLDNILAARDAAQRGADDALLLNHLGHVACTTVANVFVVAGDRLVTPPVEDGVMAGIMRGLVMEAASSAGLEADERSLNVSDLMTADRVFATNSVRLQSPVPMLDGQPIETRAADAADALLRAIAGQIEDECGFDPRDGG